MTARVYATVADYRQETADGTTSDARVMKLLRRASDVIDMALVGAVYTVDPNGYPTDANVLDVVRRATCAQAEAMVDQDDDTGVKQRLSSVNAAGMSFQRAPGTTATAMPPLYPAAMVILRNAGVLPSAPMINW